VARYRPYRSRYRYYASRRASNDWDQQLARARRTGDYSEIWASFFGVVMVLALAMIGLYAFLQYGPATYTSYYPDWTHPLSIGLAIALVLIAVWLAVGWGFSRRAAANRLEAMPGTWEYAEVVTRDWLIGLGERDARRGPGRHDGGVDVESSRYVVQVKHWETNVGGPAVRQIFGVAAARRKIAIVVAKSGYTRDAQSFADTAGVGLFSYESGVIRPVNHMADRILRMHAGQ
jgi:hypothetical protein